MGYGDNGRTILDTWDEFVCEVPLDICRTILVYWRSHGGREYVRFRTWNQQKAFGHWYPTKRFFVVPIDEALALADALRAAANYKFGEEPEWVSQYEPNSDWFKDAGR